MDALQYELRRCEAENLLVSLLAFCECGFEEEGENAVVWEQGDGVCDVLGGVLVWRVCEYAGVAVGHLKLIEEIYPPPYRILGL